MAESAFFPLVIYYLTTFYRRGELARRLALFYAASNIANAFSGLLAFGVFHIESNLKSWRYLFIIEGSLTVLCEYSPRIDMVIMKTDLLSLLLRSLVPSQERLRSHFPHRRREETRLHAPPDRLLVCCW
jgi:MFS family permease